MLVSFVTIAQLAILTSHMTFLAFAIAKGEVLEWTNCLLEAGPLTLPSINYPWASQVLLDKIPQRGYRVNQGLLKATCVLHQKHYACMNEVPAEVSEQLQIMFQGGLFSVYPKFSVIQSSPWNNFEKIMHSLYIFLNCHTFFIISFC